MKQTIVIKVGSNVLTTNSGSLDIERLSHIVEQIGFLKQDGYSVVLISSGAVASGRGIFPNPLTTDSVSKRQLWASIGQVKLINTYLDLFQKVGQHCAQVLVTKEDFRDRAHYLNMKNCFTTLLQNGVIPIVNENDVISVTELMFTDNDELAGLVASMVNAQKLIILTNVDGIYTTNPTDKDAKIISTLTHTSTLSIDTQSTIKSSMGRGGILTKFTMAKKTATLGIPVHIANGKQDHILKAIFNQENVGTLFLANKNASSTKKWLAHTDTTNRAKLIIDDGAKNALLSDKPTSLLPIGVKRIEGEFKKGDIVQIEDQFGTILGLGKVSFDSIKANGMIGLKNQKALIHYDYLYLHQS